MADYWNKGSIEEKIIGKMKAVTIPVNMKMMGKNRIMDLSEVEGILRRAKLLSKAECGCRKVMKKCGEPMDGCISIDQYAEEEIAKGEAVETTLEEAMAALKRTHESGKVHMAYVFEGDEKVGIVCSCCKCCCHTMLAALKYRFPDHAFTSRKIAVQDRDRCSDCGKCVERCLFGARSVPDGELQYDPERCYGCGLCVTTCPENAITLEER